MDEGLEAKVEDSETDTARLLRTLNSGIDVQSEDPLAHDLKNILTVICGSAELACHEKTRVTELCEVIEKEAHRALSLIRLYAEKTAYPGAKEQISHNFGNALTSITGFAMLGKDNPAKFAEYCTRITDGAHRIDKHAQDLYEFARTCLPAEKTIVNLILAVEAALNSVNDPKVNKSRNYRVESPFVFICDHRLLLVYRNLLRNSVEAGAKNIKIRMYQRNGLVRTSIRDDGEGIESENLDNIFKPFYSTKFNNLGLGLATSKRIIEKYGGRIIVESQVKRGATFTVELPAYEKKDS
jgi:nitrogen-specific signal transduction histidine kinase